MKSKIPGITSGVIDLSAGPIPGNILQASNLECKVSWSSKVESKDISISGVSDLENMDNMVTEETSYMDFNSFEANNMKPSFNNMSNVDNILKLLFSKFNGFNQLPSAKSHVLEKRSFEPVKLFTLDIELLAILGKTVRIIKSSFISEMSLKKAKKLAISKTILVNNNVRQVNKHLDQEIVIKKISVDLPKLAVKSVFFKFDKIALIKFELSEIADLVTAKWSVLMEKNSVLLRNQHWALLYILPVGTTVHNLFGLLASYDGKTCFIGCNLAMYVRDRCTVICFSDKASKLAAIDSLPVFKSVHLANIYKKKQTFIAHLVSFGGLFWTKVVNGSSFPPLSSQNVLANVGSSSEIKPSLLVANKINDRFAALKHSLTSLAEQVGKLAKRLDALGLMVSQSSSGCQLLAIFLSQSQGVDIVMNKSLGVATNSKTKMKAVVFDSSVIKKLENTLNNLSIMVVGLLAKIDNASLVSVVLFSQ
ncbi:hypothetical protein G9A89_017183 [Geosiphon pyriformis]|nr:hypothetical protein G9A89_017183 [Geosiphon pyriformis]